MKLVKNCALLFVFLIAWACNEDQRVSELAQLNEKREKENVAVGSLSGEWSLQSHEVITRVEILSIKSDSFAAVIRRLDFARALHGFAAGDTVLRCRVVGDTLLACKYLASFPEKLGHDCPEVPLRRWVDVALYFVEDESGYIGSRPALNADFSTCKVSAAPDEYLELFTYKKMLFFFHDSPCFGAWGFFCPNLGFAI